MSKTAGADIQVILKGCTPEQRSKIVRNLVIQEVEQSKYPMDALGKLMTEICGILYEEIWDIVEGGDYPGEPQ